MPQISDLSRRRFLQITAGSSIACSMLSSPGRARAHNDKLNLAFVGVGGRGGGNLNSLYDTGSVNVVGICDVNSQHLDRTAERHKRARRYTDFRRMMDELADVDAVVVSTTEHTHAFATLPALQQKKPVYCEKPLTHNIGEAHRIMQAAKEANVATQMGTQIHGMPNYRRVVELIQSKAIGNVHEAHVWTSRAWGLQSKEDSDANKDIVYVTDRPAEKMETPANLDWEAWIGPAPMRPYHDVYFPGPKWYRWWDFGSGTMSDLGSHMNDLPFWALKLESPRTIEAIGDKPHREIAPSIHDCNLRIWPTRRRCQPAKSRGTKEPISRKFGRTRVSRNGTRESYSLVTREWCSQIMTSTYYFQRRSSWTSSDLTSSFQTHRANMKNGS